MTAVDVTPPAVSPAGDAGPAVAQLAARLVARGAGIVLAVAAGMSALVVVTHDGVVGAAPGGATALAALAGNPAVRTLFGEPVALDDPGGFAVWRTGTVVAVLVAVWAATAATRVLRGEEDAGRWDLLLSGRLPAPAAVAAHLAVLVAAVVTVGGGVTLALVLTGTATAGAVVHGTVIALIGAVAVGTGGLAAQLWPERGTASGAAVGALLAGLLARMVADGGTTLEWLRWVSPFGLAALARPYAGDDPRPVAVLAAAALVLLGGAVALAGRRDLHGAPLGAARPRPPRTRLLGSVPAFAVRRLLRPLAGWALGIGAFFLLIGLVARSMTTFLADNPLVARLAADAGFAELGSVGGYAATVFALLAVAVGGFVAARIAALARAEDARHLDLLLAAPLTRRRLLAGELAATTAGAVGLAAAAGVTTWAGTTVAGAGLGPGPALAGALSTLPVVALGLGAAVLALGYAPALVLPIGLLPTAGGFVLNVIADSVGAPAWVAALSPFAHLAAVPAEAPDVAGAAGMLAVAAVAVAAGSAGYGRRDVRAG